jgi:hypothetical protein
LLIKYKRRNKILKPILGISTLFDLTLKKEKVNSRKGIIIPKNKK